MTVKLKITTKWTLKMSKLGMVSSFHPHSMCKRVEKVTTKTGRTSCTNWTISFGVSGFRTRTHLLHWDFIFIKLIRTPDFLCYDKNWMHFVYKMDILFRSIRAGFGRKLICYTGTSFFKLITTPDFFAFRTHHSKWRHQFSKLSDIICYLLSRLPICLES